MKTLCKFVNWQLDDFNTRFLQHVLRKILVYLKDKAQAFRVVMEFTRRTQSSSRSGRRVGLVE